MKLFECHSVCSAVVSLTEHCLYLREHLACLSVLGPRIFLLITKHHLHAHYKHLQVFSCVDQQVAVDYVGVACLVRRVDLTLNDQELDLDEVVERLYSLLGLIFLL